MAAQLSTALADRYDAIELLDDDTHTAYRAYDRVRRVPVRLRHVPASRRDVVTALKQLCAPSVVAMRNSEILPDGSAVLVVEQVRGTSLRERMVSSDGGIPESTVVNWMKQVCEGMTYVAARRLVHRNLKPANILIDEQGIAQVIGFDWAAFAGSAEGLTGTPRYMAPEQLRESATPDVRSDIYSFGAVFYHALTGQAPSIDLAGRCGPEVQPPLPPQAVAPGLSDGITSVLERCLDARPERRFQSFVELLTQLNHPAKSIQLGLSPPDLPGYHLLSCLGQGGMGVVFQAHALRSDRQVALKFIRVLGCNNLDLLARFRIEAEAVACLRHPNIVPVLEIGAFGGYPYLALEYLAGGSLHDRLGEFRAQPARVAKVVAEVARGLHHAHRLGVLHRDLKPQNILLTPDGTPKITDFGLAKFTISGQHRDRLRQDSILPGIRGSLMTLDRFVAEAGWQQRAADSARRAWGECAAPDVETISMEAVQQFVTEAVQRGQSQDARFVEWDDPTQHGDLLGTPAYMAPEQIAGDSAAMGPPTDVYGLGVVLYQLLFGQLPFRGESLVELFEQIRRKPPAPPAVDAPSELVAICLRCLSKQPDARYSTAAELAAAMDGALV